MGRLGRGASPSSREFDLDTALYIAEMSSELARMARGSRLDLVAYFLEMAAVEARSAAGD